MAANKPEKTRKNRQNRNTAPGEDRDVRARRMDAPPGGVKPVRPIERETPEPERRIYLPGAIAVVHEDADIIVVDKPAGLLTAGMPGEDVPSVFRAVKSRVRDQARRRGTQVWIVHRLDKEASGLLVFAKTEK
ncbi:MAG: pseudouridine synthase, partial [Phycisphaerales bacterium]